MAYVRIFLFPGLAAPCLGHIGTTSVVDEGVCPEAFIVSPRLRSTKKHLHENQLREPRSCSCFDRLAYPSLHRGDYAITERWIFTLGQRTEFGAWKIRLGSRIWSFFGIRVRCFASSKLYCQTTGTPSKEKFHRRTEVICRTARIGMAERLKPLKRFQFTLRADTGLKPGVNENRRGRARGGPSKSASDEVSVSTIQLFVGLTASACNNRVCNL